MYSMLMCAPYLDHRAFSSAQSVIGSVEEDELAADDNPTKAYEVCRLPSATSAHVMSLCTLLQLYSKRKAELIVKQSQLTERGAPTMVLLVITAFKGALIEVWQHSGCVCVSTLLLPSSLQGRCVQLFTLHSGWASHY